MARTALITGASAGLGKEFARQLAAQGYRLVLVARNPEPLQTTAGELQQAYGIDTLVLPADLSEPEAPQRICNILAAKGRQIDYLINNAGVAGPDLLTDRDWQVQTRFFELMMLSVAHMCHLLVPGMQERGFGRIINIASVAGRIPRAGNSNYGPAKAYVIALSEELSLTLRGSGVRVCALCPGFTHTEFHRRAGLTAMKNSMPKWLWYDADVVVREGLRAIETNKSIYISGRLYRWLDPFFQSVFTRRLFAISDNRKK